MAYEMISELSDAELDVVGGGNPPKMPPPPPPSGTKNSYNNVIITGPAVNLAGFNKGDQYANTGGNSISVG